MSIGSRECDGGSIWFTQHSLCVCVIKCDLFQIAARTQNETLLADLIAFRVYMHHTHPAEPPSAHNMQQSNFCAHENIFFDPPSEVL